ncbi:hypothetical protein BLNAU_3463 [Blattamonas nauphoetae]|uniref:Uncharacterized protein n=1 Tax=Blattamonas nauphoetae TaxID=2049346 RepID=A0ABQ9YD69_9EUKA|nr:hypothetical protein BLNAU_3463 [Blattamonas nauphoetae]
MEEETIALNSSNDALSNGSQELHSTVNYFQEQFLVFDPNSKLSFAEKSKIYCSLVALVNAEHPFDNALQDRAVRFLKSLEPKWNESDLAANLVTYLVPSSVGSPSGFVESISTLGSSPHSTVVAAALSFLKDTTFCSSIEIRCRLVESDRILNLLSTVQPRTL